jgi:hypothetical protein
VTDESEKAAKAAEPPEQLFQVWPRIVFLLSAIGGAFAYVVGNWSSVEPVLSSPAMVLISMLSVYGLGGLSSYWLVAGHWSTGLARPRMSSSGCANASWVTRSSSSASAWRVWKCAWRSRKNRGAGPSGRQAVASRGSTVSWTSSARAMPSRVDNLGSPVFPRAL